MKNKLILKIICFILLTSTMTYGQTINRHVIGSGGRAIESNGVRVNCTIGQTHIGLLKPSSDKMVHGVGYWYNASYLMNHPSPVTFVMVPELAGEIGKTVTVPLILSDTRYNYLLTSREFEATIKYNMTVLQPISNLLIPECKVTDGDECTVTVTGSFPMSDSVDVVLYNLDFLVRLGSVESSPLKIESFKWINHEDAYVLKHDGDLEVLGICKEGDTIRTVKRTTEAGLYASYPEPATDQALINYGLSENGYTKISLINNLGREIAILFEGSADAGKHSILVDLTDISSGLYYINLATPTERFSRKLLINK